MLLQRIYTILQGYFLSSDWKISKFQLAKLLQKKAFQCSLDIQLSIGNCLMT